VQRRAPSTTQVCFIACLRGVDLLRHRRSRPITRETCHANLRVVSNWCRRRRVRSVDVLLVRSLQPLQPVELPCRRRVRSVDVLLGRGLHQLQLVASHLQPQFECSLASMPQHESSQKNTKACTRNKSITTSTTGSRYIGSGAARCYVGAAKAMSKQSQQVGSTARTAGPTKGLSRHGYGRALNGLAGVIGWPGHLGGRVY
jgi:hypothetical protein